MLSGPMSGRGTNAGHRMGDAAADRAIVGKLAAKKRRPACGDRNRHKPCRKANTTAAKELKHETAFRVSDILDSG